MDRVPPPLPLPPHHHHTHHQKRLGAMNPEPKLLLDAMKRLFDEQDAKMSASRSVSPRPRSTSSVVSPTPSFAKTRASPTERRHDDHLQAVEKVTTSLASWRLVAKGLVDDLRPGVGKLNKHWDRTVREHSNTSSGIIPMHATAPSLEQADQCPLLTPWLLGQSNTATTTATRRVGLGLSQP